MLLAIFCSLLFFTSCDVAPKLSSISKISTSFNTGNLNFPGGLIIHGIRTDVPDKVTFTFADGVATSISLDRGDWTFYAFGYSGDADLDGDYDILSDDDKFTGALSCGTGTAVFRGGKVGSVELEVTPDGCSGKLSRTLKFKTIQARTCSAYYNYAKATNSFTVPLIYDASNTCNTPLDQEAEVSYYKVTALDFQNGQDAKSFSTKCQPTVIGANYQLPTGEVPLNFRFYRSRSLCESSLPAHVEYSVTSGLSTGLPEEFDHRMEVITATISRVLFPSAHTKRFTSPFMNNIPRILCESNNDCFNLPVQAYFAEVPWNRPLTKQLLMKDVAVNSCSGLKYNSKFFSITDCEVRNRSVYGTVRRNQLTCQDSTVVHPTYKDIYSRKNRIYILSHNNGQSGVSILDQGGSLIQFATAVALDTSYEAVAASDSGDIFVTSPTAGTKVLTRDAAGNYAITRDFPGLLGKKIEVDDSGNLMYFVKATSTNTIRIINSFDASESINPLVFAGTILKMQRYKETIHVLESSPTADPAPFRDTLGTINIVSVDGLTGEMGAVSSLPSGYGLMSFHIDTSDILNTYTHPDGPGAIFRFSLNAAGNWVILNGFGGAGLPSNADKVIVSDQVAIGIQANSPNLYGIRWNSNGAWVSASAEDICAESFDILLGGNSVNFPMRTVKTPGNEQLNLPLWDSALKFAGRNLLGFVIEGNYAINQYVYETLNEEQVITTSGGKLNRAMKLLGPHGVGGMLHEYGTCDEIKNILSLSPVPITKSYSVSNPYTGLRSYQIQVSKITESLDPFNCTANSLAPDFACPNNYDLKINVTSTGLLEKENYYIKLNCTTDAGELDYLKANSLETRKEFSLWNTQDQTAARIDSFKSIERGNYFKGEMAMVSKYATDMLWAREILFEKKDNDILMRESEYSRQSTYHMADKVGIEGDPTLYPPAVRDNTNLSNPDLCLDFNETNLTTGSSGPGPSCIITQQFSTNSKGQPLTLRQMEDANLPGSDFQNVFSIQP